MNNFMIKSEDVLSSGIQDLISLKKIKDLVDDKIPWFYLDLEEKGDITNRDALYLLSGEINKIKSKNYFLNSSVVVSSLKNIKVRDGILGEYTSPDMLMKSLSKIKPFNPFFNGLILSLSQNVLYSGEVVFKKDELKKIDTIQLKFAVGELSGYLNRDSKIFTMDINNQNAKPRIKKRYDSFPKFAFGHIDGKLQSQSVHEMDASIYQKLIRTCRNFSKDDLADSSITGFFFEYSKTFGISILGLSSNQVTEIKKSEPVNQSKSLKARKGDSFVVCSDQTIHRRDLVMWTSQAGGKSTEKRGLVVGVVKQGNTIRSVLEKSLTRPLDHYILMFDDLDKVNNKEELRIIVLVKFHGDGKDRLYYPNLKSLFKIEAKNHSDSIFSI